MKSMKKVQRCLAVCMMMTLLFGACGTVQTGTEPTSAPEVTESPMVTETPEVTTPVEDTEEITETPTPEATEAPNATELPIATETPVATEVPAPTEAPVATASPKPTATPYPKAPIENGDLTYGFDGMVVCFDEGVDYTITKDGSLEIQFNQQYSQIRMVLPEAVDLSECVGLTIKMNGTDAYIDVCFFGESLLTDPGCKEAFAIWGLYVEGQSNYQCSAPEACESYGIGFMVGTKESDYSRYKFKIDSVTFHMVSGNKTVIPKNIAPDVTEDMTLLNTYGTMFDKVGAMVTLQQLENPATLKAIKEQFNSVTMGYHLDYLFAEPLTFISVEEAKKLGYSIPEDYPDEIVPKFDFTNWDKLLKICADNGLGLRGQASTCNGQVPKWFFSEGYKDSGAYVTPEEMNARNEFYIRTIMEHVYNSEYGHVVYSWDLINEYYHTTDSDWVKVYGKSTLTPDNMKRLYEAAADVLELHGIRDKVTLVMNEYRTYVVNNEENVPDSLISIANYINSDIKALDAIGMQGTLETEDSAIAFKNAMKKYMDAGYEVLVTEINIAMMEKNQYHADLQTKLFGQIFKEITEFKKDGANINVISFAGVPYVSGTSPEDSAYLLMYYGRPKDAFYSVLQSYTDVRKQASYTPPKPSANGSLIYEFKDMEYLKMYYDSVAPKYTLKKDGAIEIQFLSQYQGFRLALPEGIDMSRCTGVTFKIKAEYSNVGVSLLDENVLLNHWADDVFVDYGCQGDGVIEYTITPNITDDIHGISIMSLNDVDDFSKYTVTLYSVTFHMKS